MLRLDLRFSLLFGPQRVPPLVVGPGPRVVCPGSERAGCASSTGHLCSLQREVRPWDRGREGGSPQANGLSSLEVAPTGHRAIWLPGSEFQPWGRPRRAHLAPSHALLTASFQPRLCLASVTLVIAAAMRHPENVCQRDGGRDNSTQRAARLWGEGASSQRALRSAAALPPRNGAGAAPRFPRGPSIRVGAS